MSRKLFFISALMCAVVLTGQGCSAQDGANQGVSGDVQMDVSTSERAEVDMNEDQQEGGDGEVDEREVSGDNSGDQDLNENERRLVGVWKHVSTEGGVNPGPVTADITWTFNADGTGEYYQNPEFIDPSTNEFEWSVDEDGGIYFTGEPSGEPQYSVETWGDQQMKWYNPTLGDYYIVEKQ